MRKKEHTLLICDDEPDLLELYAAMLSEDYKIIKASSGDECIRKYIEMKEKMEDVTVILLDFRIGEMTGDKVARDIKLFSREVSQTPCFELEKKEKIQMNGSE